MAHPNCRHDETVAEAIRGLALTPDDSRPGLRLLSVA